MASYNFDSLKSQYTDFSFPIISLTINGKSFSSNTEGFYISDIDIDLTSGFEASQATYRIYNCIDNDTHMYKYDKLKNYILLGSSLSIQIGYGQSTKEVFVGFIAQVNFICEEDVQPCVEIVASDMKGVMMASAYAKQLISTAYSDAVKEVLQRSSYNSMISNQIIRSLSIDSTPDKSTKDELKRPIEMITESDYEFIVKAAKKFNFEFFSDCGIVYFREAKKNAKVLIELGMNAGLLNYHISYDIRGLVETVEARGMVISDGTVLTSKTKVSNKISSGSKAKSLISGSQKIYIDPTITTKDIADARVEYLTNVMANRFGTLNCECVGLPELKPGNYIEIEEVGGPAENQFYVTRVQHIMSDVSGYRTILQGVAMKLL